MNARPAHKKHSSRNFTMVELLVVTTIIAVLASMLLPALNLAREKGRSASCQAQLRQLGLAFYGYRNDYNEYLPNYGNNIYDGKTDLSWGTLLIRLKYAQHTVFSCPSIGQPYAGITPLTAGNIISSYCSYGIPFEAKTVGRDTDNPIGYCNVKKVRYSSRLYLLMDSRQSTSLENERGNYIVTRVYRGATGSSSYGYPHSRHSGGVNILHLDGHIEKYNAPLTNPYAGTIGDYNTNPCGWYFDAQ